MEKQDPKYQVGQEVEAQFSPLGAHEPATIKSVKVQFFYDLEFRRLPYSIHLRSESQIRPPRPTEEEAWEKAAMLIGRRGYERYEYCCMNGEEVEDFHKETRHRVYQILGSAGIKVTAEVKADIRRLISVADNM